MHAATVLVALLAFATSTLRAQHLPPPSAPVVSVSGNLKELIFDWERVPNAYTYWLMEKKDASSPFTRIGVRIPGSRPRAAVAIAVHLQNWGQTRYAVAACNTAGCTRSADIDPNGLLLDTIGYFKASNTNAGDMFGGVVMSSDGSTMAVSALFESSNATGVNGNQADNSSPRSGAVYVYRRDGRRWRQEAYLKAAVNQPQQSFGGYNFLSDSVALSGDGSWLAVGAPYQQMQGVFGAGTAYLFHREADGSWTAQGSLNAPTPVRASLFGDHIDMTTDGSTIKVTAGVSVDDDIFTNENQLIHFFERQGSTWQYTSTFEPAYPGFNCGKNRLSRDGSTLLVHCGSETEWTSDLVMTFKRNGAAWSKVSDLFMEPTGSWQPLSINDNATRLALIEALPGSQDRVLKVLSWSGGTWVREDTVEYPESPTFDPSTAGWMIAVEFDRAGSLLAVSAPALGNGVVYLFDRTADPQQRWKLRRIQRSPVTTGGVNGDVDGFGISVSLSASGWYMAVGAWREDSNAVGIDGDRANNSAEDAGAVYLY